MARLKMLAHRALIGAAFTAFFLASTAAAYQAAGVAVTLGSYALPR